MAADEAGESDPLDTLITEWLSLAEVADRLGVSPNRVRQWARERELTLIRTAGSREPRVPAAMLQDDAIVRGLGGTLTLLADSGFEEREAVAWLFTDDESLPGRPIDALRANRGKEVRRRAQAMAF